MKIQFLSAVILLTAFTSCKNQNHEGDYNYSYDNLVPFIKEPSIIKEDSLKGNNYCVLVNKYIPFGPTFKMKFKDLGENVRSITIKARCKYSSMKSVGNIVCTIDAGGQNVLWNSVKFNDFVSEPGKWTEVKGEIEVKSGNNPENVINIYPWSDGDGDVLVDDLSLTINR